MANDVRDRHPARGRHRLLAMLALLAAIGPVCFVRAAHEPAPVADEMRPAELKVAAGGGEVSLEGDLSEGTGRRLRILLRANASIRVLSLDSDGGLVDEAEQVGDIVAAHALVTVVRSVCVSACTLAYVRGRERYAQDGARFGFHAPWVPTESGGEFQVPSDDEREAYLAAGVAGDFVREALAVPASSIWYPDAGRLLQARVVTAIVTPEELSTRLAGVAASRRLAAAAE